MVHQRRYIPWMFRDGGMRVKDGAGGLPNQGISFVSLLASAFKTELGLGGLGCATSCPSVGVRDTTTPTRRMRVYST
jgi:hypothetical protein